MSKTGVAKRIREALKHGPMTTAELRVCLDLSRGEANTALNDMMRAKEPLVGHDGGPQGQRRYMLLREPKPQMTPEERKARRLEQTRIHNTATRRRKGMRTWAEYVAEMAARPKAAPKPPRVSDEQRRARAERKAAKDKAREERQQAKRAALLARLESAAVAQIAETPRLMSSAEWGGPIQRLEPCEVSKPLRITREVVRRMAA